MSSSPSLLLPSSSAVFRWLAKALPLVQLRHSQKIGHFTSLAARGMTLIEIAIVLVVVSVGLVPVVRNIAGNNNGQMVSGSPAITNVSSYDQKAIVAASSIINRFTSGNLDAATIAIMDGLAPGGSYTSDRIVFLDDSGREYREPIEYQWVLQRLDYLMNDNGDLIDVAGDTVSADDAVIVSPLLNHLYRLTVSAFKQDAVNPLTTLQTFLYTSDCNTGGSGQLCQTESNTTGLMIVADRSASMVFTSDTDCDVNPTEQDCRTDVHYDEAPWPYLKNRYPILGNNPSATIKLTDYYNNANLDMTYVQPENSQDPNIPYSLIYPYHDLGTGFTHMQYPTAITTTSVPAGDIPYFRSGDTSESASVRTQNYSLNHAERLDRIYQTMSAVNRSDVNLWQNMVENQTSRYEGLRNGLLTMLVALENNDDFRESSKMGLITFSNSAEARVELEQADDPTTDLASTSVTESRFINVRKNLLMINREGTGAIMPHGGTNMADALEMAAERLIDDPALTQRIVVLVTDGNPNAGTATAVQTLASAMGSGCYPATTCAKPDPNKKIAIFAVNVIGGNYAYLEDLAWRTPGGMAFNASDLTELQDIFDLMTWQVQWYILLNNAQRFHLYD